MKTQPVEHFDTDEITDCVDAMEEMAQTDPIEVRRIVDEEIKPHMGRHMRPFAEEWSDVARAVGLIK